MDKKLACIVLISFEKDEGSITLLYMVLLQGRRIMMRLTQVIQNVSWRPAQQRHRAALKKSLLSHETTTIDSPTLLEGWEDPFVGTYCTKRQSARWTS
jgi:hypothetical protein